MQLVEPTHPVLRAKAEPFDFGKSDATALARDMADLMLRGGGVGLAAPQVGLPYRVAVIWSHPVLPMFNPVITSTSEAHVLLEEACLSFPGLTLAVKRPKSVRVRFQLPSGEWIVRRFEGLTARVVQHEVDHLDGKLFFERASRAKLDAAIRRARKHGHDYTYAQLMGKRK